MWSRWANELLLWRHVSDGRLSICILFFASTALAAIGLWTRYAVPFAAFCALYLVYYMGYLLGQEDYTHHHTTLLAWAMVWLALTPSGRSYSVDRWLALRRAERSGARAPEEQGNLWGLRLMSLQVAALYLWTAIAKCNLGFLSGARLAHYTMKFYTGSSSIDEGSMGLLFMLAAWATVALELALAVGLLFAKTRRWLLIPGLLLHGAFYALLDVSTFSVTMCVLYLSVCDADEVHRAIDRLNGYPARTGEHAASA
jgi:hypothetical protein